MNGSVWWESAELQDAIDRCEKQVAQMERTRRPQECIDACRRGIEHLKLLKKNAEEREADMKRGRSNGNGYDRKGSRH